MKIWVYGFSSFQIEYRVTSEILKKTYNYLENSTTVDEIYSIQYNRLLWQKILNQAPNTRLFYWKFSHSLCDLNFGRLSVISYSAGIISKQICYHVFEKLNHYEAINCFRIIHNWTSIHTNFQLLVSKRSTGEIMSWKPACYGILTHYHISGLLISLFSLEFYCHFNYLSSGNFPVWERT